MEAYTLFAEVYDSFMEEVPYDEWMDNLKAIFEKYNIGENASVIDLGCGTGEMTLRLEKSGYEVTGIDLSSDMLSIAAEKTSALLLCQDMTSFDMPDESDAIVSICDCMNYLLEDEAVVDCFNHVAENLSSDGIFVFDFNTRYKYENILADNTFAETREEGSFIWENEYDSENLLNYYDLTFYIENESGSFDRFFEDHVQKAYDLDMMENLMKNSKLKMLEALDVDTGLAPTADSERIYIIAAKR